MDGYQLTPTSIEQLIPPPQFGLNHINQHINELIHSRRRTPLHCAASCNHLPMIRLLVENGAAVLYSTINDNQTALQKCEPKESDFENCCKYLNGFNSLDLFSCTILFEFKLFSDIQNNIGNINSGMVYALFNYTAQNSDELSFEENDKIQVIL